MSARPGGWVPGIGWVVRLGDLDHDEQRSAHYERVTEVVVRRWADGSTPSPSPVESEGEACSGCGGSGVVTLEGVEGWCPWCDDDEPTPTVSVPLPEWEAPATAEFYRTEAEAWRSNFGDGGDPQAWAFELAALVLDATDRGASR